MREAKAGSHLVTGEITALIQPHRGVWKLFSTEQQDVFVWYPKGTLKHFQDLKQLLPREEPELFLRHQKIISADFCNDWLPVNKPCGWLPMAVLSKPSGAAVLQPVNAWIFGILENLELFFTSLRKGWFEVHIKDSTIGTCMLAKASSLEALAWKPGPGTSSWWSGV